jgi:hypothetical protein
MTEPPESPRKALEEVIAWATGSDFTSDVIQAKAAYLERTGQVFDDDRQLESRLAAFLEHYVCDRVAPHWQLTPARARYELSLRTESPERARAFRSVTETIYGLFEVRKIDPENIRLRSLFGRIDFVVTEHRHLVGLAVADVLECRLLPLGGQYFLTPTTCFHPHEAATLIQAEAKRRLAASTPSAPADELVFDCAGKSLKVDRYRQISIANIYTFSSRPG